MIDLVLFGFFAGFIVSMIGLGGGVFFIPLLVLVYGIEPVAAVGISLSAMTAVTFASSIGYFIQKKINFKLSLLYDVFDIPGVILGSLLALTLLPNILLSICAIIILLLGFSLLFYEKFKVKKKINNKLSVKDYFIASISSLFGGIVTGLSGMGGGTTDTTTMILMGVPLTTAVASSEFAMFLTNLFGLIVHNFLGSVDFTIALPLSLGALVGALVGTYYSKKVKTKTLRKALAVFVIILGIRLLM